MVCPDDIHDHETAMTMEEYFHIVSHMMCGSLLISEKQGAKTHQ